MSLIETAANLFAQHSGYDLDPNDVTRELQELLPTNDGELDIGELITRFSSQGGGLTDALTSWLGDGDNAGLDTPDLVNMLGESKVKNFAENLGIDFDDASNSLANMVPGLIDENSSDGSADIGGNLVNNLMGRLF